MPKSNLYNVVLKKLIGCVLLSLLFSNVFSQLKNFGTRAKFKPEPNYIFSVYAYADLVREDGIGFQYQLNNKYNLDFSAYLVNPNTYFKDKIKQWDYYDLKGYGFSLKPKFQFSKLSRFYVGLNLAYESLRHDNITVEYFTHGAGTQALYHNQEDAKGFGYTIGLTLGNKLSIKQVFFEPFFGLGVTTAKFNKTIYSSTNTYNDAKYEVYPKNIISKNTFFQLNIGLKLGFSFKKSKKHDAVDKKFDAIYIPKATNLNNYFKNSDQKKIETSKYLRQAYSRTKKLNGSILRRYKQNYRDTTVFYRKVDTLFQKIDLLIIKGNP